MIYRLSVIILATCLSSGAYSQIDLSEFSASLRTKMAEEEQIASESDPVFQSLMEEGFNKFENQEYDEAIAHFEQAGARRPINVYPPVMIEDVKLAMANHVEEEVEEPEIEEITEEPKEPEMTAEERVELMYQQELAKVYDNMPPKPKEKKPDPIKEPEVRDAEGLIIIENTEESEEEIEDEVEVPEAKTEKPLEVSKPSHPVTKKEEPRKEPIRSLKEIQEELADEFPDGVTEEVFQEGNRTITKRIVVKDGLGDEYRKVKHGWGGVFYFKNGVSISERVWIEETSK